MEEIKNQKKMKLYLNNWLKSWNIFLFVPCLAGLYASYVFAVLWYAFGHAGTEPISKKEELEIRAQCAAIFLLMGLPFFGTTYTAIRFLGLPVKDMKSKFTSFIKIRQYCFLPTDFIFVFSLTGGDKLADVWITCGVMIVFQILLFTVDDVIYHEIKDEENGKKTECSLFE